MLSLKHPHWEIHDHQVVLAIVGGKLPTRPNGLSSELDTLWELCQICWKANPAERPSAVEIEEFLRRELQPLRMVAGPN